MLDCPLVNQSGVVIFEYTSERTDIAVTLGFTLSCDSTLIRAYLRASTKQQDAKRAKDALKQFAKDRGLTIAASYIENESGASLKRPELFRLMEECEPGDILLVEQVDRISRLNGEDWKRLKAEVKDRKVRIVPLDLPTSWQMAGPTDSFKGRMQREAQTPTPMLRPCAGRIPLPAGSICGLLPPSAGQRIAQVK